MRFVDTLDMFGILRLMTDCEPRDGIWHCPSSESVKPDEPFNPEDIEDPESRGSEALKGQALGLRTLKP